MDFDDPDFQGQRAGASGAAWWVKQYPNAIRWPVPEGKDPGDYIKLGGDLKSWVMVGISREGIEAVLLVKEIFAGAEVVGHSNAESPLP
jgi:hypothetical protein